MHSNIRANRGWIDRKVVIRPKTRLFTVYFIVWCVVSFAPADILVSHAVAWLSVIGIFCWIIVSLNPILFLLALYFRFTEHQMIINRKIPDPNYDLEHLD